jgi:nucleolar protein 6
MADGKKLTKREKKAASFRQKQKGKTVDEDNAVPESDLVPDQEEAQPTTTTTTTNNKRKADSDQPDTKDDVRKGTKIDLPSADTENKPAKKKTRRGKTKAAEGSRFIVFVGNLSYTTTKEDLEKHFASAGGLVSVRLLTDKETKKPKGFAFLEFQDSSHLNVSERTPPLE